MNDFAQLLVVVEERLTRLERNSQIDTANIRTARDLISELRILILGRQILGEDFWSHFGKRSFWLGVKLGELGVAWGDVQAKAQKRRAGGEVRAKQLVEQGAETRENVLRIAVELIKAGYPRDEWAGIIAERLGLNSDYARRVLREMESSLP